MRFSCRYILIAVAAIVTALALGAYALYTGRASGNPARVVEQCAGATNKPLCYADTINALMRSEGIPAAFDALAFAYDTDREFAGTCHSITHELGKASYEEYDRTGKTELTSKAWYCGYGFYHGFMDALYVDTNDMERARGFCSYVGKNVPHPPPPEFAEGSCYHGIGHGVTDGTDPRVWGNPVAIVKPGLALCAKVADGNEVWHMRCVSGVFNALGNMYPDPKYKLDPGTNPYTLCKKGPFTVLERETCYNQMNTQAAALGNNSLTGIMKFVDSIEDLRYREAAIHEAVAYYIAILKRQQKILAPEEVVVCEEPTSKLKEICVNGFVSGIIEFGSPGLQYKEILQLCGADAFPQDLRSMCYSALQMMSRSYYTPDVSRKICALVPQAYRTAECQS